jgi:phosphatidylserine/phosphatidylglycerophosphate/cardiolipin synthase-like enzyme
MPLRLRFAAASLLVSLVSASSISGCAATSASDEPIAGSALASSEFVCDAVHATAPGHPSVFFAPFDAPERQVLCALSAAKREVLIAHYNIRREVVLEKLIELKRRGVDVRVAIDEANSRNEWNKGDDMLEEAGVHLVRTKPSGAGALMHLKVAVIDNEIAMTGSFNWNETAALANDENMVVFRDAPVVQRYRNQVLEVLGERPRARETAQATPHVRVHFTPEERVDTVITSEIDRARTSVDVAMFTFTHRGVVTALERAARRGVRVRVVIERKQEANESTAQAVEGAGGLVVRAGNRIGQFSAMHQKYAIVDGTRVITGATNWTNAGTRTNEEDLLLLDLPDVAAKYRRNFADLLYVYGGLDTTSHDASLASDSAPVLFNPVHGSTAWGDRVVVVGSDPRLGSWDPWRGLEATTHESLFPSWSATARLPAGTRLEYKFVTLRANGTVEWEPGPNRVIAIPETGRAVVTSGAYGDTQQNWTPRSLATP